MKSLLLNLWMMKIAACGALLAAHLNPSQSESIRKGFERSQTQSSVPVCGIAGPSRGAWTPTGRGGRGGSPGQHSWRSCGSDRKGWSEPCYINQGSRESELRTDWPLNVSLRWGKVLCLCLGSKI